LLKRFAEFLRSVIPADPYQLIFLVGVVFLFVSPRLPWGPLKILESSNLISSTQGGGDSRLEFVRFMTTWLYPIIFAGLAGYCVCLWPGKTPIRRILWAVCLPTVLSLVLILHKYFQLARTASSIFELHGSPVVFKIYLNAWKLSPGLYFCAVGLVLILVYTMRLALGLTSLPLSLPNELVPSDGNPDSWPQVRLLIFVLVGPLFLIAGLFVFLLVGIPYISSMTGSPVFVAAFAKLAPVLDAALLVGISVYILGKQGRDAAQASLRLPEPRYAVLGVLLPLALSSLFPTSQYLIDRAHWAAHDFGKLAPPQFFSYFDVTNAQQPWILLTVFGGFAEEMVFRGLLLPNFLRRFGLHRGIFLTGIVWAAVHFRSDSYSGLSVDGVLLHLANRVFLCLALNYVFAWMTLRWSSIIPAAIAHSTWNILVSMQQKISELWDWERPLALWAILAYVLLRFWPITGEETAASARADANP